MNSLTDQQLLREYAEKRSEAAFAELVRRQVDLVYSAALRMVCDPHLAQDVTQGAFLALAQNASQLADHPVLSGWLHRTAQNLAVKVIRTEVRRRAREQEAATMNELLAGASDAPWEQIAPHLDAALGELGEADRAAILLRFFEKKSLRDVGVALGTSDEAAQKRVSRAVERLRDFFAKRGVTAATVGGLATVIAANAVQAAPAGLAAAITAAAKAAMAAASLASATTAKAMTTASLFNAKTIAAILAAAVATGAVTHLAQQREVNQLRDANERLAAAQSTLVSDRDGALAGLSRASNELERLRQDQSELLRLRAEVGSLRTQSNELATLRDENSRQQSNQAAASPAGYAEENRIETPVVEDARALAHAAMEYAGDNHNQLPDDFSQAARYLTNVSRIPDTNRFELMGHGSLVNLFTNKTPLLLIREREPTFVGGHWIKVYAMADGNGMWCRQPPMGFDAWEKQLMTSPTWVNGPSSTADASAPPKLTP